MTAVLVTCTLVCWFGLCVVLSAAMADDDTLTMEKMELVFEDRDPMVIDLTQSADEIKNTVFEVKEGVKYKIRLSFLIKYRIVSGLRYHEVIYRKGISVDKTSLMVGSYGPKDEPQVVVLEADNLEFPKGLLARGHYTVKSKVIDNDNSIYMSWEWSFNIRRYWA